jgi:hypothetical protein
LSPRESRHHAGARAIQPTLLALGLFLLAPLVAEFLLGNLPLTALGSLLVLAPLYGGGALLIREAARRLGRGWPTLLAWALAYALLEEGIVTMSLFNPGYAGADLLATGFIPALGIGAPWTVQVLAMHTVWSIAVPIALVEALAGPRRAVPWLGRLGLTITAGLFAVGLALNTLISVALFQFVAAPLQLIGTGLLVLVLVASGLGFGRRSRPAPGAGRRPAPSPWLVGGISFVVSGIFRVLPLPGWWSRHWIGDWPPWLLVGLVALLAVGTSAAVVAWSRRRGWGEAHRLALAGGALLTYAWAALPQRPVLPADPTVDLIGNAVFAAGAVALLVVAARRQAAGCENASVPVVATQSEAGRTMGEGRC